MASALRAQIQQLIEVVEDGYNLRFVAVASLALLVWDYLLTFSQEVEYVWTRPITKGKLIFFFLRYGVPSYSTFSLITNIQRSFGPTMCTFYGRFSAVFSFVAIAVTEYVLLQRVIALLGTRIAKYLLTIAYVLCFMGSIVATVFVVLDIKTQPQSVLAALKMVRHILFGCITVTAPKRPWLILLPALAFETILFVCTLYRAARLTREATLVQRLIQDGTIYFFVAFFSMLFTSLSCLHPRLVYPALSSNMMLNFLALTCTRLQLRLLEAAHGKSSDLETTICPQSPRLPPPARDLEADLVVSVEVTVDCSVTQLDEFSDMHPDGLDSEAWTLQDEVYGPPYFAISKWD